MKIDFSGEMPRQSPSKATTTLSSGKSSLSHPQQSNSERISLMKNNELKELAELDYKIFQDDDLNRDHFKTNIENHIGYSKIPLGVAGPILINGQEARGEYLVPMATTEGALVASYHRGMRGLSLSGGVHTQVLSRNLHVSPALIVSSQSQAIDLILSLKVIGEKLEKIASLGSQHTKLISVTPKLLGSNVLLKLGFDTGDAMGQNMANMAANRICEFLCSEFPQIRRYYLRSNASSDKKASMANLTQGYGHQVVAQAEVSKKILRKIFRVDLVELLEYCQLVLEASTEVGMVGVNGHFANGMTAIFIATGQDVAQIAHSTLGQSFFQNGGGGNLHISLNLNCLTIGTIGGGTGLPTQKAALDIMGVAGTGRVNQFAEIIGATLLAGELSLSSAIVAGDFLKAHQKVNRLSKENLNTKLH